MKSTDNVERASADVARSSSLVTSNFAASPTPIEKLPSLPGLSGHVTTLYRPGGLVNHQTTNDVQHQIIYNNEPQTINLLNYNMTIKSLPLRSTPMTHINVNQQNFANVTMQQTWQVPQFGLSGDNTQVSFNLPMQCKPINGFLPQNFFQKGHPDNSNGGQIIYSNNIKDQLSIPSTEVASMKTPESVLPFDVMQTPHKKVSKKSHNGKSKESARNTAKTTCLSPVSDCDMESSNSNSASANEYSTGSTTSKKSSTSNKGKKLSAVNHNTPQQESQMAQNSVFDKLASLGSEPDRKIFLSQLFSFMNFISTPVKVMPVVCRQTVDLYKLFNIVKNLGGLEKVCKMKQWRDVSSAMGFGGSTSAGFALKKNYCKYLFAYECRFDRDNIDPNPILVSLDLVSKLETKKKSQEASQSSDGLFKEDSVSQDSFLELSSGLEDCTTAWERPIDRPIYFNYSDNLPLAKASIKSGSPEENFMHQKPVQGLPNPSDMHTEHIKPTRFKRRKLTHHDCGGSVDIQKVIQSLSSGMLAEVTWALDYLSIVTYDPTYLSFNLSKYPKLLDVLLNLMHSCMYKLGKHVGTSKRLSDHESKPNSTENKLLGQLSYSWEESNIENHEDHYVFSTYQPSKFIEERFFDMKHLELKQTQFYKIHSTISSDKHEDCKNARHSTSINIPNSFEPPRRVVDQAIILETRKEVFEPGEDLFNNSDDTLDDLSRMCICMSNILRNLASMSWNEKELATSSKLLTFLSFCLNFHHEHHSRKCSQSETISDESTEETRDNCENCVTDVADSFLWWKILMNVRSNCIVILSYITGHLNLSSLCGDICFKLCRGLLHWSVCQSSEALDSHSGLNVSIQRIALEALSKLCISRANADFVVATPPFSIVVYFVTYAVKVLYQNDSDIVRDILLGILSKLVEAESNIARVLTIDASAPFVLLGLIDDYIDPPIADSTGAMDGFVYDTNSAKVSSYTACKAAEILCQLSRVPENIEQLAKFKKHLLEIATSSLEDDSVAALVSEVLAAVS